MTQTVHFVLSAPAYVALSGKVARNFCFAVTGSERMGWKPAAGTDFSLKASVSRA